MDPVEGTVKGTLYPLNSKRLKLQQIQYLARALDLPAEVPRGELEVMIGGQEQNSVVKEHRLKLLFLHP